MKVLLVKMSSLGDVVHALPAVTDAVRHGHRIDWVVEEAFADVARLHPGVGRVLPIAWRRWRKSLVASRGEIGAFRDTLRSERYDLVLDSQGLLKSAGVVLAARAARRAGYSFDTARESLAAIAYGDRIDVAREQHAIDRQRQLFAAALGYELDGSADAGLAPLSPDDGKVFLLHGTTWATKHWPESMWIELARIVQRAGKQPLVTWGNSEEQTRAAAISAATKAGIYPRSALADLVGALAAAELVIGVDSGLMHLSAALGVPTLGLYGPTDAVLTGCRGAHARVLQSDLACSPCMAQTCTRYQGDPLEWQGGIVTPPCFAPLNPERVWLEASALLNEARTREG
jgi:heptosyltransferase-1